MKIAKTGVALSLALVSAASAATNKTEGETQTLKQVLAAAYEYNSEIQAKRAEVRAADEAIVKAKSGYRPTIDINGNVKTQTTINSGTYKTTGQIPSSTDAKSATGGVQLNQNIFQGFNTQASVGEAESARKGVFLELTNLEQRVFADTVTAYLTLLSLAAEVRLLKASAATAREQYNSSEVKLKVGEENRTSVAQAQAQLLDYMAQLSSKEAQLAGQRATFTRLTGLTPSVLARPSEFTTIPTDLVQAIDIAMNENPDIQSKKYAAEAAEHAKTRVSSGLWPKIDLQAGSEYTKTNTKNRDVTNPPQGVAPALPHMTNNQVQSTAMLTVSMHLYEGGGIRAERRQAGEASEQKRVEIETTRRSIAEQLAQQWTAFKAARTNLEYYQQQVVALEVSTEGVQLEMQAGTKILYDVLQERAKLTQAQQNLVGAERDYYIAGYKVIAFMGRLTSTYLNLPVQKYDAEAHYEETVDRW